MDIYSLALLAAVSFFEAIILPFPPPDVIILALTLEQPEMWWAYALISLAFSLLGGAVGFKLGKALQGIAKVDLEKVERMYERYGHYAVIIGAISPLPFKVFSIGSGFLRYSFGEFLLSAAIGRGTRFIVTGYLSSVFGKEAISMLESNLILLLGMLVAAMLAVKIIKDKIL